MSNPLYIGVDPDLRRTAVAGVDGSGEPVFLAVCSGAPAGKDALRLATHGCEWVVDTLRGHVGRTDFLGAEVMQHYPGSRVNANDLLPLNLISAAAVGVMLPETDVEFLLPRTWKGTIEKPVHQARLYRQLGWEFETLKDHSRPTDPPAWAKKAIPRATDWKHVGDAIGIARYLWERETKLARRTAARERVDKAT